MVVVVATLSCPDESISLCPPEGDSNKSLSTRVVAILAAQDEDTPYDVRLKYSTNRVGESR
jgi:hypothetical protein